MHSEDQIKKFVDGLSLPSYHKADAADMLLLAVREGADVSKYLPALIKALENPEIWAVRKNIVDILKILLEREVDISSAISTLVGRLTTDEQYDEVTHEAQNILKVLIADKKTQNLVLESLVRRIERDLEDNHNIFLVHMFDNLTENLPFHEEEMLRRKIMDKVKVKMNKLVRNEKDPVKKLELKMLFTSYFKRYFQSSERMELELKTMRLPRKDRGKFRTMKRIRL